MAKQKNLHVHDIKETKVFCYLLQLLSSMCSQALKSSVKIHLSTGLFSKQQFQNICYKDHENLQGLSKMSKITCKNTHKIPVFNDDTFMHFCRKEPGPVLFLFYYTRLSTTPYVVCLYVYRSTFSGSDNFKIIKSFPDGNDSFSHFTYVIRGTHGLLIL